MVKGARRAPLFHIYITNRYYILYYSVNIDLRNLTMRKENCA